MPASSLIVSNFAPRKLSPLITNTDASSKILSNEQSMIIFCGSKASAQQTLEHIVPYIEKKLFLKVNREKTVVAYAGKIKFLGYGFYKGAKGFGLRVHAKSKARMKAKVKELTSRSKVNSYEEWKEALKRFVVGWVNYYKLASMTKYLKDIDEWMRRRIRMVFWKKWKRVRTRWRNLLKLGILIPTLEFSHAQEKGTGE